MSIVRFLGSFTAQSRTPDTCTVHLWKAEVMVSVQAVSHNDSIADPCHPLSSIKLRSDCTTVESGSLRLVSRTKLLNLVLGTMIDSITPLLNACRGMAIPERVISTHGWSVYIDLTFHLQHRVLLGPEVSYHSLIRAYLSSGVDAELSRNENVDGYEITSAIHLIPTRSRETRDE